MKSKKIPTKNYLLVLGMIIGVIIICLLVTKINFNFQDNKIKTSPLTKIIKETKYKDLSDIIKKDSKDMFIYLSYTNDLKVYTLENNLKQTIEKNNLKEKFIYVNLSNKNNLETINELNNLFNFNNNEITKLPTLIYYRNNEIKRVITSNERPFHSGEFNNLLDIYELSK